jgi:hypothetical protein
VTRSELREVVEVLVWNEFPRELIGSVFNSEVTRVHYDSVSHYILVYAEA